jgi:hypothetical protein
MNNQIVSKTRTTQLLRVLKIVAWVAFVGYLIQAGAMLLSFGVSFVNPDASADIYKGLDLQDLRDYSVGHYGIQVGFRMIIALLKASVAFLVIKAIGQLDIDHPFKIEIADLLEQISFVLLATWAIGVAHVAYSKWLAKFTDEFYGTVISIEFIFMAGLVFIIAQIFKRGVEIQNENELTV